VASGAQVLQDELLDPRILVEEPRNGLQLGGVIEIEPGKRQPECAIKSFPFFDLELQDRN
jgi:hypothetical protein